MNLPASASLGKNVDFEILLEKKEKAIVVPALAVRWFMGDYSVRLFENNILKEVKVEFGI